MGSWEPCTPAPPGSQAGAKSSHARPTPWALAGGAAGGTAERELTVAADFSLEGKTPHKRPVAWHLARAKIEAKTGSPGGWPALPLQRTLEDRAAPWPAIRPHTHRPPGCLLLIWKPLSAHPSDSVCLSDPPPSCHLAVRPLVCLWPPSGGPPALSPVSPSAPLVGSASHLPLHLPVGWLPAPLPPLSPGPQPWPRAAGPWSAWSCWGWGWLWPSSCPPWSSPGTVSTAAPRPLPTLRSLRTPKPARTLDGE